MSWWSILIIILVVLFFVGKAIHKKKGRRTHSEQKYDKTIEQEAEETADKVTTLQQVRKFEDKVHKAADRINEAKTGRGIESAERKLGVLEKAQEIIENKVFTYQFIPSLALDTPQNILDAAYKVYQPEDIDSAKESLSDDDNDWMPMDMWAEKEDPEPFFNALKKFRLILDSDELEEKKAKKVNQLVKRSESLAEEFFVDDDFTPWEQWQIDKLNVLGAPLADVLYREGIAKPEDYLKIDPDEFIKRKGVGPKTQQALIEFQEKIRNM